jgi:GNAT superfamily N-acetyltransferase
MKNPVADFLDATLERLEVAEVDGRIIGAVLVVGECLQDLHVFKNAQWKGVGRRSLLERAMEKGATRLEFRAFNGRAIAFYERRGWVRCRTYDATEMGVPVVTHEYRSPTTI